MNYFSLFTDLLQIGQEVFRAIESAITAGKDPSVIHQAVLDHAVELPGKIRAV